MVKSKLILLFIMVIGIVIISGCTEQKIPPSDKPYITNVSFDKSFGIEGDIINVAVSVTNPTKVNYNGYILIQADSPNCFGMGYVNIGTPKSVPGYDISMSVLAETSNSVLLTMKIPYPNQATCYQPTIHQLNIFLLQNGQVLDSKTQIDFSLFQKK